LKTDAVSPRSETPAGTALSSCAWESPGRRARRGSRFCSGVFSTCKVIQHQYYDTKAEDNRISIVPISPIAGSFSDRNGVCSPDYSAYTLELTFSKIADSRRTIDEFATIVTSSPRTAGASSA